MTDQVTGNSEAPIHTCGYVAIVGLPNSGKSTLLNRFHGEKVSIVTSKPQTTRANVTTILSSDTSQIIFIDTPGLLKPRYRMQEVMSALAASAIKQADVILVMIDAARFSGTLPKPIVRFAETVSARKVIVGLNKIDLVHKPELLPMMQEAARIFSGAEIVPVSALKGDGADELLGCILSMLPAGPKLFPDDIISTEPERFFAAEFIREAVFLAMKEEIPYASAVVIEGFEDKDQVTVITASILVEKDSQKPIVIGRNGATIRNIGIAARTGLEVFLGRSIFLDLHVKVRHDWRNRDTFLREIGLTR